MTGGEAPEGSWRGQLEASSGSRMVTKKPEESLCPGDRKGNRGTGH